MTAYEWKDNVRAVNLVQRLRPGLKWYLGLHCTTPENVNHDHPVLVPFSMDFSLCGFGFIPARRLCLPGLA